MQWKGNACVMYQETDSSPLMKQRGRTQRRAHETKTMQSCMWATVLVSTLALLANATAGTQEAIYENRGLEQCNKNKLQQKGKVIVVGSVNVDVTIAMERLPKRGETVMSRGNEPVQVAVGGKGANQAVGAARLARQPAACGYSIDVDFIGQFGTDSYATWLRESLVQEGVRLSSNLLSCNKSSEIALDSGQGFVLLEEDGSVSSVVVGGSNQFGWPTESTIIEQIRSEFTEAKSNYDSVIVMIQREIPEIVNEIIATVCDDLDISLLQDVGGADRPIADSILTRISYLMPNESELSRITDGMPTDTNEELLAAANKLRSRGAKNILVTLGSRGAMLLKENGDVLWQKAVSVDKVVDATAAGDAFRAAFAVMLSEGETLETSLKFASSAGSIAVQRHGALPSLPYRNEAMENAGFTMKSDLESRNHVNVDSNRTDVLLEGPPILSREMMRPLFASRLNAMRERLDLWHGDNDVLGWIQRQGRIAGLDLVYLNYPQHLKNQSLDKIKSTLKVLNISVGAICMRYPENMGLGALTNPKYSIRRQAIELTVEACEVARKLHADHVIIWPQNDGYDF